MDRRSVVVAPTEDIRRGGTVSIKSQRRGSVDLELTFSAPPPPPPTFVNESGVIDAAPIYVVRLPWRLAGQKITGEQRTAFPLAQYSWNLWRGSKANRYDGQLKAPSLVGFNVADAREVFTGLGVPANHVRVKGPRDGYVAKQRPARTGWINPGKTRVTLTTKSRS